jgi:hypothetical protein
MQNLLLKFLKLWIHLEWLGKRGSNTFLGIFGSEWLEECITLTRFLSSVPTSTVRNCNQHGVVAAGLASKRTSRVTPLAKMYSVGLQSQLHLLGTFLKWAENYGCALLPLLKVLLTPAPVTSKEYDHYQTSTDTRYTNMFVNTNSVLKCGAIARWV